MTRQIKVKATGEKKVAVYAPNSSGNMRYNVDGKFYSDKKFDQLFEIEGSTFYWKSDTKSLFEEIIECGGPSVKIMKMPLNITYSIMREAAKRAMELQDRKMIAIMGRLGLYDACQPKHPEYKEMSSLIAEFY